VQLRKQHKTNQTDYLFVSQSLLPQIERCSVHNETPSWRSGDHCLLSLNRAM
jgi:hypothetical protein